MLPPLGLETLNAQASPQDAPQERTSVSSGTLPPLLGTTALSEPHAAGKPVSSFGVQSITLDVPAPANDAPMLTDLSKYHPKTAAYLQQREREAVGEDLGLWENLGRGMAERTSEAAVGFNTFVDTVTKAAGAPRRKLYDALGLEPLPEGDGLASSIMDLWDGIVGNEQRSADLGPVKFGYQEMTSWAEVKDAPVRNFLPFALEQGLISTPDMLLAIANMPAFTASMTGRIGQQRAENDGRAEPTVEDMLKAMPAAVASAFLERLGGRGILGLDDALKGIGVKEIAKATGKGAAKEGLTEGAQEGIESAGATLGTEKGFDPAETGESMIAGMVAGGGFGGAVRLGTTTVESTANAARAKMNADKLSAILDTAKGSKLRTDDPAKFAEHLQTLAGEDGEILIDAKPVAELFQADGSNPFELFDGLGVTTDALNEALATGGDVAVDVGAFVAALADNPHRDQVLSHVREDIGAMTLAEADVVAAEIADDLGYAFEGIWAEEETRRTIEDPANRIFDMVYQQLREVGAYDAEGARAAAELYRQQALTLSEAYAKDGKDFDVLDFFESFGLDIRRGEDETTGQALVDGVDVLLEELRNPNLRKTQGEMFGPSLLEFLAKRGGVRDPGGDLAAMDAGLWHQGKPGMRKLLNDAGESMDDAALAAWEAGYFPDLGERPDINSLLDAMGEELRGTPRHAERNVNERATDREALLEDLQRAIEDLGLDVATTDNATIKATLAQALNQSGVSELNQRSGVFWDRGTVKRGSITFADGETVIRLFKDADPSTFLHETGHLFLKMMADVSLAPNAPEAVKADFDTALDWLGVKTAAELDPITGGDRAVEAHEKWARGFEEYLRSGKSPSAELQTAFARFKAWMLRIYTALKGTGVDINDDIRGVFDRMLATEDQIAAAEARNRFELSPALADILTDGEVQALGDAARRAHDEAVADVTRKRINIERRETTKWWKEEAATVRAQVQDEVYSRPIYRAWHLLSRGELRGEETPEALKRVKLSLPALVEFHGEGVRKLIPRSVPPVATKDGKLTPDDAAQLFGFDSTDAFVHELLNMERPKAVIEREVGRIMKERHGDPLNDGSLEIEAQKAVHGDQRGVFLRGELRALARKTGKPHTPAHVVDAIVDQVFADKPVGELLKPMRYEQQAMRAAKAADKALLNGDFETAFQKKREQVLNHALFRRALQAKDDVAKIRKELTRLQKKPIDPNRVHPEYVAQVKNLLEVYSFGPGLSDKKRAALMLDATRAWMERMQETPDAQFVMPDRILEADNLKHWRDMPLEDLKGLRDVVRSLMKAGRENTDAAKAERQKVAQDVADTITANAKSMRAEPLERGWWQKAGAFARLAFAEHRKIENLTRELDKYATKGTVYASIFQPIKQADDRYIDRSMQASKALSDIMNAYTRKEQFWLFHKIYIPELGHSLSLSARLAFALNMGNAGNVEAMQNEYSDAQIKAVLTTLTDKDWDVVEAIWKHIDSYWPDLSALEERTTGVKPPKVEAVPFKTPSGRTVVGGYYPLVGDPRRSEIAKKDMEDRASLDGFLKGGHAKASTKHGSTIARKGFGTDRRVWLDLGVAFSHVDGVIKDIELREAVREVHRLVNSREVEGAFRSTKGAEYHQMLNAWVENVVAGSTSATNTAEKIAQYAKNGVSIAEMGLSLRTMLQQPFGITQSIAVIGERYATHGVAEFAADRSKAARKVMEASAFMRNRGATFDRDVRDAQRLVGAQKLHADVARAAFWGIQKLDMAVSIPTWLGAHEKALADGLTGLDAIDYADGVVARSQGSGLPRDMADIQQGPVWKRLFTMFYSFFSAYYNVQTDLIKQTDFKSPAQGLKFAKNQIWLTVIPALVIDYLFNGGPEDDEGWMEWSAKSLVQFGAGGVVILRDILNAATTGYGYQPTPVGNVAENALRAGEQLGQGEADAALTKSLIMTTGYLGQLPGARQAARSADVLFDEGTDNLDTFEGWWRLLVQGKEK